jgi:ribosome-associated toxin RatA of RatAB toxin-antitoxin module
MALVKKSVLIGYSAEQMYALVDRVEDYPQFLPWCGGVDVQRPEGGDMIASLAIHYHGIKQTFTTRNTNVHPISMKMTLVDGPFKHLEGTWLFRSLREDACKIEFELHYEFSNKVLDQVIGPVFGMIANSFVDSFCKRAEVVYA